MEKKAGRVVCLRETDATMQALTATALRLCSVSPAYMPRCYKNTQNEHRATHSASIPRHASASTTSASPCASAAAVTCTRVFLLPSVIIFATFPATTK